VNKNVTKGGQETLERRGLGQLIGMRGGGWPRSRRGFTLKARIGPVFSGQNRPNALAARPMISAPKAPVRISGLTRFRARWVNSGARNSGSTHGRRRIAANESRQQPQR